MQDNDEVVDHLIEIRKALEFAFWILLTIAALLGVIAWKLVF